MRRFIPLLIAAFVVLALPAGASAKSSPYLTKTRAWMETFDFAHGVADRMDDGTYKDVIPVLDRQSKCRRVSRSQIDCGFNISLWPWSFDGGDPIECRSVIRTRATRSYGEVLYSSRAVGKPRCHFI